MIAMKVKKEYILGMLGGVFLGFIIGATLRVLAYGYLELLHPAITSIVGFIVGLIASPLFKTEHVVVRPNVTLTPRFSSGVFIYAFKRAKLEHLSSMPRRGGRA